MPRHLAARMSSTPLLLAALLLAASPAGAADPSPFDGKPLAAAGVHVDDLAQWRGARPLVLHEPDEADIHLRQRLGTVRFAPGVELDLETEDNQVNFPFFFELLRTGTRGPARKPLLRLPVMDLGSTQWYFPGNGFAYVNSMQWRLCGPRTTRKFALSGGALVEVPQPLVAIDAPSLAQQPTPLYETPDGGRRVATVAAGTRVQVLAMTFAPFQDTDIGPPLLVRTPLGLLGWHRRYAGSLGYPDGLLDLYQCN